MTTSPSVNLRQLSALQLDPNKIGFPRSGQPAEPTTNMGRDGSRADVGTDWLRALTNEQLAIVSGWIEAAGAVGDQPGRPSQEARGE